MKQRSTTIAGVVLGIVLLVVIAGFAIFLPKVQADPSKSADSVPALPTRLAGLVALDSDDLPSSLAQQIGDPSQVVKAQKDAGAGLEKVFGKPAAYKIYASADAKTFAAVTVLDAGPGLFSPDGPPAQPATGQQPTYQLSRSGGAVCAQYFQQAQPQTQGAAPGPAQLARVHCQLGADGRTYDIDARGLTVAKTVAALKSLAST